MKSLQNFEKERKQRPRVLVLGASPLQLEDLGATSQTLNCLRSPMSIKTHRMQKLNLKAERKLIRSVSEESDFPCDIEFSYTLSQTLAEKDSV